ncbi:MAG: hypothetical protein HYR85_07200 [Planctomycetes bacterium]|nr:hypothetical protein [Planctomycetota bacterium]MBI3848529.1 hypothetical protein [Planctomycetota bacterium]
MSILTKWQRQLAILRLRKEIKREPHISTYVSLVERHLFQGDLAKASQVVDQALLRYPDSERLAVLQSQVRKVGLRVEIDQLRRQILTAPTPETFERLADLYLSLGEAGRALRLAAECARKFPNDCTSSWIEGRIGLERYRKHRVAKEGRAAVDALERVVSANAEHWRARRILSELYLEIGAGGLARPHLEALARRHSTDESIQAAFEQASASAVGDVDLEKALTAAEESRLKIGEPTTSSTDADWLRRLREQTGRLVKTKRGIVAAQVVGADEKLDPLRWDGAAEKIADIADSALHRMDLGGLHDFRLSGPFGHLVAFRSDSCWLLFLCSEATRFEAVMEAALEAISEARVAGGEVLR